MSIQTSRILLVPATADLVALEIDGNQALGRALDAEVPSDWPPAELADALPWFHQQLASTPELSGWLTWYGLALRGSGELPLLVASCGFFGLPEEGTVEVGYSVLPGFRQKGYATEAVGALVAWALSQPAVDCVTAEPLSDNVASIRVLEKLNFVTAGPGRQPGSLHYERRSKDCLV